MLYYMLFLAFSCPDANNFSSKDPVFDTVSQMLKARVEREYLKFVSTRIKVWKITQRMAPYTGSSRDLNGMSLRHFTNIRFPQNPLTRAAPLCVNAKLVKRHSLGAEENNSKQQQQPEDLFYANDCASLFRVKSL